MGRHRNNKIRSTSTCKEDSSAPVTTPGDSMSANEHHVMEEHPSSDEENYNDEIDLRGHKQKKDNENDDDGQKKIRTLNTITNLQFMQKQMFTMIQDIKQNVDEMYTDWKANGGFGDHTKNNTRWIEIKKNSLAFGMTVALNYLDLSKSINMVPSEHLLDTRYVEKTLNGNHIGIAIFLFVILTMFKFNTSSNNNGFDTPDNNNIFGTPDDDDGMYFIILAYLYKKIFEKNS
ncbi:hypothetical protein RhiirC2_719905 [Rhizophagus irregularis]|uniref:Uncharacterized protein n=1 Tax=Rhizophagus irregularis TaxID=588596 RepID=A0A2N1MCD9_9GLOM|nr:hypothetical protein RhiirC2_719905 [Rhizophagus irregularis]